MRRLVLVCLACGILQAGTRVRDTIYYPNGKRAEGRVTITWPAFAAGGRTISAGARDVRVVNGVLDVELEPMPTGLYYTVQYRMDNGTSSIEYWVVPVSATAVRVAAVRVAEPPQPNIQVAIGQIAQSGAQIGQMIRWDGVRWQMVTLVDQETPSGAVDGSNAVFTLAHAPDPPQGLIVFRNGIAQKRGLDYDISGNTITFTAAATPQPGDVLLAWYRY
jgi:hypothetical protein